MAGLMKVDTEQVAQIATTIEGLNKRLSETLENTKAAMNNLKSSWEGGAATETITAFNGFAQKYFQDYHEKIDNYVKFLRKNVAEGYFEVEKENTRLADVFK